MDTDVDCNGCETLGIDYYGWFIGTENAWFVYGDPSQDEDGGPDSHPSNPHYYEVSAFVWGEACVGYFVASTDEIATHFIRNSLEGKDIVVNRKVKLPPSKVWRPGQMVLISPKRRATLLNERIFNDDF